MKSKGLHYANQWYDDTKNIYEILVMNLTRSIFAYLILQKNCGGNPNQTNVIFHRSNQRHNHCTCYNQNVYFQNFDLKGMLLTGSFCFWKTGWYSNHVKYQQLLIATTRDLTAVKPSKYAGSV